MKKVIILILTSVLFMGCASTEDSTDDSANAKKNKTCTSVKVMGSNLPKRICKS